MSIENKLITIANNTPLVCSNLSTPKTVSGNTISLSDVSPVEHSLDITLASDTVMNFSEVTVSRYGKNLLSRLAIWRYSNDNYSVEPFYLKQGDTITFSFEGTYTKWRLMFFGTDINGVPFEQGDGVNVAKNNDNAYIQGTYTGASGRLQHSDNLTGKKCTNVCNRDCIITGMAFWNSTNEVDKTYYNCQLEIGSNPTDYEPYKQPQTITANSDGTVTGLTSLSPNMTLISNSDSVSISCTYRSNANPTANEKFIELQDAFARTKAIITVLVCRNSFVSTQNL